MALAYIICPKCEYNGKPARKKRGSSRIELYAWLTFPLGIPYTLWRMFSRYPACPACGSRTLIDADSVVGLKLQKKMEEELAGSEPEAIRPASLPKSDAPKPRPAPANPDQW